MSKLDTKSEDWQVTGVASVGIANVAASGLFFYEFKTKNVKEMFLFVIGGVGAGGSLGSISAGNIVTVPNVKYEALVYSPIMCIKPFSIADLHISAGRLSSEGASFMGGYNCTWITAFNLSGDLFLSQYVGGISAGVGVHALTSLGIWLSLSLLGVSLEAKLKSLFSFLM